MISILLFTIYIATKTFNKFRFKINILNCIKYDSVELFNNLAFFFIFLFGLSNALEFGEQYALAITFVALITDTQWDILDAISTVAKIDISKNKFNYKEHRNNAYKLLAILLSTVFLMFITLFRFYDLELRLTLIYTSFELVNFVIYPIYKIKTCYLQLEYSPVKTTTNKIIASISRFAISLLPTPFCTAIGQVLSSIYQFISINMIFNRHYKVSSRGEVERIFKNQTIGKKYNK